MGKPPRWIRNTDSGHLRRRSIFFESIRKVDENFIKRVSSSAYFPSKIIIPENEKESYWLIDSDSVFKIFWDLIIMSLVIYSSYSIPFCLSFQLSQSKTVYIVVNAFFLSDILISFNTTYYSKGMLIESRAKIIKHYLKGSFFLDILASFPYEFFYLNQTDNEGGIEYTEIDENNIIRYIVILKLLRLYRYNQLVYNIQELFAYPLIFTLVSAFSFVLGFSLLLHLLVCIENIIFCNSLFSTYQNNSSLLLDPKDRYLKIMNRVMETVTSVGYGEFVHKTVTEKSFAIPVMGFISGLFGYYVGSIQSFIEKQNQIDIYFNEIIKKAKHYLKQKKCSKKLISKVVNFIRNLKRMHSENLLKEQDIINILSSSMKEEVFSNIQGHYLLRLPEFKLIRNNCLKAISYNLKLEMFAPNDIIVTQGELTFDLYFVVGGNVEVFHDKTKTCFRILSNKSYFGEISFFCGSARKASVKSVDYCEVLKFQKSDFTQILNQHPRDKELIDIFIRNTFLYGISVMGIRCFLCEKIGHVAIDCQNYIYVKPKYNINYSARKIFKPGFIEPPKVDVLKRYKKRNTKGYGNDALFCDSLRLKDISKTHNNWLTWKQKKSHKLLSLIESFADKIEEEGSLLSEDEIVQISYSHLSKVNSLISD